MSKCRILAFFVILNHIKGMDSSFLELKSKQVINTVDGKCLGYIADIIFDIVCAKVRGFVVPQCEKGFLGIFKTTKELFIPYDCVCKIGVDTILVELYVDNKKAECCKDKN